MVEPFHGTDPHCFRLWDSDCLQAYPSQLVKAESSEKANLFIIVPFPLASTEVLGNYAL